MTNRIHPPTIASAQQFLRHRGNTGLYVWTLFLLVASPWLLAADTPSQAIQKVRKGLQHFQAAEYSAAETAFSEATEIAPDNATIIFDRACAALADADPEQARELFRKASLAKDVALALKAHYNLGCLEADQAREKLGDEPVAAEGKLREESINLLLTSIRHYRDVLRLEPTHPDARHNLELIRLYIKHLQSEWAERDRQKDRDEKDLLQFLMMIEEKETQIRSITRSLSSEPDSAHLRQAVMETAQSLRTLQEEIEPLKQKITQQFQAPQTQPPAGTPPGTLAPPDPQAEQREQAEKLLSQMADKIGERLLEAATALDGKNFKTAIEAETNGLDQTNHLYMAVAPYQDILQRALSEQQTMLPPEVKSEDEEPTDEEPTAAPVDDHAVPKVVEDFEALLESQSRITDWSSVLSLKAENELPQAEQQLETLKQSLPPEREATPDESPDPDTDTAPDDSRKEDPKPDDNAAEEELTEEEQAAKAQQEQMLKQKKQLAGLVESMKRAIELAPQAVEHSQLAEQALTSRQKPEAEPEQRETLRILKEIAEPLVKQDQQNQDQDQQQNGDNKNQDQSDQGEQEPQEQKNEDQKPQDKEQQQQEQDQSKQEQAESILRKAREREREHREMQKQLRALLRQGIKVDRDW